MASSSSVAAQLRAIQAQPSDAKFAAYEALAHQLVKANNPANLLELAKHLLVVEHADQFGRTYIVPDLLALLVQLLADPDGKNDDPMDVETMTPMLKTLVDLIRPKAEDMPDALMNALDLLAKCHQANGDYKQAAYTLSSFKFDDYKNKSSVSVEQRVGWHVSTASFFLAVGESGLASQQIKRAHALMGELAKQLPSARQAELTLRFKSNYARILDSERKFLEAAMRYAELSQIVSPTVTEADRLQSLQYAISCAILAKAGAPRSRVLALLYSDERSKTLPSWGMLEKMFKERIIAADEVAAFEQTLQEHQKADTSSKRTVLQNSVCEHNLLAAARIYANIRFDQLGALLGVPPAEAEKLASNMIEQQRLHASIDQVEGLLEFLSGGEELQAWDSDIADVCQAVNHVLADITKRYPEYDTL